MNSVSIRFLLIIVSITSLTAQTCTALLPQGVQEITTVEGITEYSLPNGMQVLLFPDPSKPTFTVNITYRVGSRHEGRGEAGMAHLLEHMVFKGTPTFPQIWKVLQDHGASFNGTTWLDRTNYFETFPTNDENLDFALKMEADRMINSDIAAEELAKEMTVVRNEFERGENSPTAVLSERIMSAAFLWHNYGKSTIGNRSDIERVPVDKLKAFYKKYYQPDNATLIVAGKFDQKKTLGLIAEYFGRIPKPQRVLDDTYTEEPPQDGARMVTLKRAGDVAAVGIIYHIPAGTHPDFAAISILSDVLTDQPSGRLYRGLVTPGMASSVSSFAFPLAEPGVIELSASVTDGQAPPAVLDYMIDTVESLKGITDEEVERAKASALKSIKLAMTDSGRVGVRLSEFIAQGDWRLFFMQRDRLQQVTTADVQTVAEKYLIETNRTAGMFLPTKEIQRVTIPETPDVVELVNSYTGTQTIAKGEEIKPEVDFLEGKIERTTLPSGIKVALLPLQMRGDSVRMSVKLHYGTEPLLTGVTTEANLIPTMLMRGTKQRSYQELSDEIDRLQSRISVGSGGRGRGGPGGGIGEVTSSIQSDRENLVPAIQLLAEILQQPAFDLQEFETVVNRRKSMIQQMMSEPQALGMLEMRRKMSPWPEESIHYVPTQEERLQRLENASLDGVRQLYEATYGASNMEVAVVGDFDPEEIKEVLQAEFGGWKSPTEYVRVERPFLAHKTDSIVIHTPDKAMAVVGVGSAIEARDTDPAHPALTLASYVLGESSNSRLMKRLRHQGGMSYGARAAYSAGSQDPVGALFGYAICAPENATKALEAMKEEIDRWKAEGITDEELQAAKKSYQLDFDRSIASEQTLVRRLLRGLELDRTLRFQEEQLLRIQQLSQSDIQSALKSVFGAAPTIEVMAGDLNGTSENETAAPLPADAAALTPANGKLPPLLVRLDVNQDGQIQVSEAPERLQQMFDRIDQNGDGALDVAELAAMRRDRSPPAAEPEASRSAKSRS